MNLKSAVAVLLSCAVPGAATVKAVPVRVAVPTAGVPLAPVVLPAVRGGVL